MRSHHLAFRVRFITIPSSHAKGIGIFEREAQAQAEAGSGKRGESPWEIARSFSPFVGVCYVRTMWLRDYVWTFLSGIIAKQTPTALIPRSYL